MKPHNKAWLFLIIAAWATVAAISATTDDFRKPPHWPHWAREAMR